MLLARICHNRYFHTILFHIGAPLLTTFGHDSFKTFKFVSSLSSWCSGSETSFTGGGLLLLKEFSSVV
jgi:hypothetical protein